MKALLNTCLLCTLFSPGTALLNCYQCLGNDCATPGIQECGADEAACIVLAFETTLASSLTPRYQVSIRQCAPASSCLLDYLSMSTLNGGSIRSDTRCCYTDLCNDFPFSLPELVPFPPNGVQCPSCFAINSTECEEVEKINCTGGETKCILESVRLSIDILEEDVSIYLQGCGTPNICFIPHANISSKKVNFIINQLQCIQDLSGKTGEPKSFFSLESTIPGQGARSWDSSE